MRAIINIGGGGRLHEVTETLANKFQSGNTQSVTISGAFGLN